jgi:hypothetical protein
VNNVLRGEKGGSDAPAMLAQDVIQPTRGFFFFFLIIYRTQLNFKFTIEFVKSDPI